MAARLATVVTLGFVAFIALACGGETIPSASPIGSQTTAASLIPTPLPSLIPTPGPTASIDTASATCRLLSATEVGLVMGFTATVTEGSAISCVYTDVQTDATLNVRFETGDLALARSLLGDTANEITISGYSGLSGTYVGSPMVYVQRGADQLVLQGVLVGTDDAAVAKVVQLANTAASRW